MVEYREKRASLRHDCAVTIITSGQVENYTKNIGYNGLLCYTQKYIGEMTLLDMKFQFPRCPERTRNNQFQGWIECQGVVVRCDPVEEIRGDARYELAVYFSKISDANKKLLAEYVEKHA